MKPLGGQSGHTAFVSYTAPGPPLPTQVGQGEDTWAKSDRVWARLIKNCAMPIEGMTRSY